MITNCNFHEFAAESLSGDCLVGTISKDRDQLRLELQDTESQRVLIIDLPVDEVLALARQLNECAERMTGR